MNTDKTKNIFCSAFFTDNLVIRIQVDFVYSLVKLVHMRVLRFCSIKTDGRTELSVPKNIGYLILKGPIGLQFKETEILYYPENRTDWSR